MYLLLTIVAALIGMANSQGGIGDIPFSQLTLNMVFGSLFAALCYAGALYFLFKSFESDRIWPWRWTLPYFGNLVARTGFCALFIYGAIAFAEKRNPEGWWAIAGLAALGISLLYVMFSSEFEFFEEKKKGGDPEEEENA